MDDIKTVVLKGERKAGQIGILKQATNGGKKNVLAILNMLCLFVLELLFSLKVYQIHA